MIQSDDEKQNESQGLVNAHPSACPEPKPHCIRLVWCKRGELPFLCIKYHVTSFLSLRLFGLAPGFVAGFVPYLGLETHQPTSIS
jgi:hypothetical protein